MAKNRLIEWFRYFFLNTNLHGFRFIAQEERHWTERVLWAALCTLSWIGSGLLFRASWDSFQNNAVSFVVETTYLNANVTFPAVSVCEEEHLPRVYEAAAQIFGEDHNCNLDEVLKEITYFRGTAYYITAFCFSGEDEINCPKGNYSTIAQQVRSPCELIFVNCTWRDVPFDCCKHFKPMPTELGTCFTLRNEAEENMRDSGDPDWINMVSNRQTGLPNLKIILNVTAKVYLHSDSDVPFYNTITTEILDPKSNGHKTFFLTVTDIEVPLKLSELSVHQRQCRFPHENYLKTAKHYSYSSCVVDCRREAHMRVCNCTSHLMPYSDPSEHCDLNGIYCLNKNANHLMTQKTKWGTKPGLNCDCLPTCKDPEYNIITTSEEEEELESGSIVEIRLERFAAERYKRNVVRSRLDLVVSMGSAASLFVGASLLSFIEIFYFVLIRTQPKNQPSAGRAIKPPLVAKNGKPFFIH